MMKLLQIKLQRMIIKVSTTKTKVMAITGEQETINIEIERIVIGKAESFNYLGVNLEGKARQEVDINERINKQNFYQQKAGVPTDKNRYCRPG